MDLKQLTALVTIAETGSVSKAAQLLNFVQPTVTRQITLLEMELGVSLFERSSKGMKLTPAGAIFAEGARQALQELERARRSIRPRASDLQGVVTLGLLESVIDMLAEGIVTEVTERYPGIELGLATAHSSNLQDWLHVGRVHLSLLDNLRPESSLAVVPLVEEELWAVGPADAGLVSDEPVDWQQVLQQPLILPPAGHGLRTRIDRATAARDVTPKVITIVNSLRLQKNLVRAGRGWTILPAISVIQEIRDGRLCGAPLRDPAITRQVVLGLSRTRRISPEVDAVAVTVQSAVRALVERGLWPGATIIKT